ncbi:MAG TPA: exodeoxyribonuclease VII small subunit [Thermomicrobiales bacterium]
MAEGREETLDSALARWEAILRDGTFEQSLGALEEIVQRLEEGQLPLEGTLRCYELGVQMARRCETILDEAELRITRLDDSEQTWDDTPEDEPSF